MESKYIDHLFRHHSGKMVSVLTRIFGLSNLNIIEDAVQDTFIKASISWRLQQPENPEAWLTKSAKNRVIDILRKLKKEKTYLPEIHKGTVTIAINKLFLDTEIEDAQLRMIFTACHPDLNSTDRISFALKTVSGFSIKEISSALLTKEDTIKKRLFRARTAIQKSQLKFNIPQGKALPNRLESVMEVLYLIFNEGFHSNNKEELIRQDLCGEAMRLCKLLLKNKHTRTSASYALYALMCFHSARLSAKINTNNELLDLKHQDRTQWYFPLIELGNMMMNKAVENLELSCYHYEATIASEHIRASSFEDTNWNKILIWYQKLHDLKPMPSHILTMAVVCMQQQDYITAKTYLDQISPDDFQQRAYLYYGTLSDYYINANQLEKALIQIDKALATVTNLLEKDFLEKKRQMLSEPKKN
ncbi:sigma-70 family RNA polymerase sigma factor [Flavobacteriaceae bacterium S0825]|uniref:RNA polymerase sigma factor n=1 Tax=Gaetbulibacter sp. S0825 TaxID=2720084 RepID=UPI001430D90D|nr:sigma-70 family RNA polymerase sigma factor [Gaetbulibacter sp. S0825]MCK0109147.1 sigma-70 family RNA polymerase sigma factor [Flavobacteriaceae bacterium S0825]NIX64782.1 sigma-70 family RNA polymerase sigma factor [Gaetbulibacter sp. S0825]